MFAVVHKELETQRCALSPVATDALVLKHKAISIQCADYIFIVFDKFHTKMIYLQWITLKNEIMFWKQK